MESLNLKPLWEQVYDYLQDLMRKGELVPGSFLNLRAISAQLGISNTPLRDALIHLEVEGFVTILPRRGVQINPLTLKDVRHAVETVGMVESAIVQEVIDQIPPSHILALEELNQRMIQGIDAKDLDLIHEANTRFHQVCIALSDNALLSQLLQTIDHRFQGFTRQVFIREYELQESREHEQFIAFLKAGDGRQSGRLLKDVHWNFAAKEGFIKKAYQLKN